MAVHRIHAVFHDTQKKMKSLYLHVADQSNQLLYLSLDLICLFKTAVHRNIFVMTEFVKRSVINLPMHPYFMPVYRLI